MMPLNVLFWCMEAAYIVHCLDETIAGNGFVKMVNSHFWPEYSGKQFFWFNTLFHILNISGIILYEIFGGMWVIWPLSFCWLFVTNGLWHVLGSILFREYSPGLMTSPLYWIVMYFIIRYNLVPGQIEMPIFMICLGIGTLMTVAMIGSLFLMPAINKTRVSKR